MNFFEKGTVPFRRLRELRGSKGSEVTSSGETGGGSDPTRPGPTFFAGLGQPSERANLFGNTLPFTLGLRRDSGTPDLLQIVPIEIDLRKP